MAPLGCVRLAIGLTAAAVESMASRFQSINASGWDWSDGHQYHELEWPDWLFQTPPSEECLGVVLLSSSGTQQQAVANPTSTMHTPHTPPPTGTAMIYLVSSHLFQSFLKGALSAAGEKPTYVGAFCV